MNNISRKYISVILTAFWVVTIFLPAISHPKTTFDLKAELAFVSAAPLNCCCQSGNCKCDNCCQNEDNKNECNCDNMLLGTASLTCLLNPDDIVYYANVDDFVYRIDDHHGKILPGNIDHPPEFLC